MTGTSAFLANSRAEVPASRGSRRVKCGAASASDHWPNLHNPSSSLSSLVQIEPERLRLAFLVALEFGGVPGELVESALL